MVSGVCLDCGADFSSKCLSCRNVFWNEQTRQQFECPHKRNRIDSQPEKCIYSGCKATNSPRFSTENK